MPIGPTAGFRTWRVVLAVMLAVVASGMRLPSALAQDPEAEFAAFLDARRQADSLAGPSSGELVLEEGFSVLAGAGVSVLEFSTTATVFNPRDESDASWDFGFTFHQTPDIARQVVVDSTGVWSYSPYPGETLDSGFVPEFDGQQGGSNVIDLVVAGDMALFGVNDVFVASIPLPSGAASDLQLGSGYFTNSNLPGRALGYTDFQVWALPDGSATDAAGAAPTVSPEDAEAFAMILASQSRVQPLAGPFNANLTEEEGRIALSWANVDLADFHARATFAVPETASDIPWNVGFMFRASPAGTLRVAIDSGSNWYFAVGPAPPAAFGLAAGVVTDPGATNTLDLIVADDLAVLGVNGSFSAAIDLPADSSAADVAAGAAFFTDQTLPERVTGFSDFVVLPFDPDAVSVAEPTLSDADEFASLLAETAVATPLAGPFAGRVVESSPGTAPLAPAGVALSDFGAVATFVTPADVADGLWDAGFQFRGDADVTHRLILGFNGEVYAVLPGESPWIVGTASTFESTPGAANVVQLFVEEGRALVGVNGEFVAAIDLAAAPVAADVLVGAAIFAEDFVQGRVTTYEDFRIWEIV